MTLARFTTALERHKGQIDDATYWRYRGGRLPRLITWLLERPDLAMALAEDAIERATGGTEGSADDTTKGGVA